MTHKRRAAWTSRWLQSLDMAVNLPHTLHTFCCKTIQDSMSQISSHPMSLKEVGSRQSSQAMPRHHTLDQAREHRTGLL